VCTASGNQLLPTTVSDAAGGAIVTWNDSRVGNSDIYAQRVARYGYLGTPEAMIVSVTDVANDQGGKVKLSWNASYLESDPYFLVTNYKVFRSVPPNSAAALEQAGARILRDADASGMDVPSDLLATMVAGITYYWEYMGTVTSDFLPNYSYLAPTAGDNSSTAFMVQARTAGTQHWESLPMSGTSVDNLAPAAPDPFTANYFDGATHLHWGNNMEPDLASYRLYRGDTAGFLPGPGNLIATQSDTGYVDVGAAGPYYKLSAVDVHGNESAFALVMPAATTEVPEVGALAFAIEVLSPNPASGSRLDIRFALPTSAPARIELLDVTGRRLLTRDVGGLGAGRHALDLAAGSNLAPGIYWVRLIQGSERRSTKIAMIE
jgi:hypothetical protein